jgi:endonuclease/exonuclease/phosphatase family metal-dependent hydrolase
MLHGFPRFEHLDERLAVIEAEVRRVDPDIVCLQEVPWRPGLGTAANYLAERLGLNHVYVRANGNRWAILFEEGEAILSRYPLRDAAFVELTPRAGFFEHRVALRAVAQSPWGDIVVFVTHLTNGDPHVNEGQTHTLRAYVEQSKPIGPSVIAGDFNATEASKQIGELDWLDAYRASNPGGRGFTCCVADLRAGPEEPLEQRIDFMFYVPGPADVGTVLDSQPAFAKPQRIGEVWLWSSDHVGILSVLSVDGSTDPRRETR